MSKFDFDDFLLGRSPEDDLFNVDFFEYTIKTEEAKERLASIYDACLIKDCDLSEESIELDDIEDLVVGTGILKRAAFSASKIEEYKEAISEVIDDLYLEDLSLAVPSMECGSVMLDYEEGPKAIVDSEWEWLIQLGNVTGELSVLTPVEEFEEDGPIYIVRNNISTKEKAPQKNK